MMNSGSEGYERQVQKYCKLHTQEEIKAFCKNDLCSICFKCLLGEHRNHEVVMLEDLGIEDLKDKVTDFHDKVDEQVNKLSQISERVGSIKENYDKKFEGLFNKFKNIEDKFLNGFFEENVLGELKNSKEKQQEIVKKVATVLEKIESIAKEITGLRENPHDFFLFENIRNKIELVYKELNGEERELKKLSCTIADYSETDIKDKFSELLQNTFILKKSYTSAKNVHYFEWGSKHIHFYEVEKLTQQRVSLGIDFNIPKFCRTVVTDEGRIF
jgi:DNA repair ATPase RecN